MMQRGVATTVKVFAFNRTNNTPVTGGAGALSCKVSIDGGARVALADTTATELEDGYYVFDVSASETNGTTVDFFPESSTANVQVIPVNVSRYTSLESQIKAKTDLITGGVVQYVSPVSPAGNITGPIFAGDDYKASIGNAFTWTINARTGYSVSTATCRFGGASEDTGDSWNVSGTVSDLGGGQWQLSFDLPKATTSTLSPGFYRWSVELVNPGGDEVTEVYNSNANRLVEVREKQT